MATSFSSGYSIASRSKMAFFIADN